MAQLDDGPSLPLGEADVPGEVVTRRQDGHAHDHLDKTRAVRQRQESPDR
ncbi:MAG TPA: hypothetical protein VII19_07175 [Acidimicrobiales bacterium]